MDNSNIDDEQGELHLPEETSEETRPDAASNTTVDGRLRGKG
jgi:hypothetical protein